MIEMRIYEVDYELESPIILSLPTIGNVYHTAYNYLPGSTIRGAILTYLQRDGFDIEDEMLQPSIVFHPAYPVRDGYVYKPAHCLVYECKICKKEDYPYVIINPYEIVIKGNDAGWSLTPPFECNRGHPFALKPIGGELIAVKDGKSIEKYNSNYAVFNSVGIKSDWH